MLLSEFNDQLSVTGAAAVEGEVVELPEVDADRKDEATLRDAVAEEVLGPAVEAPPTGWRVDRFRQSSGRMRRVSAPLWSLRPPMCPLWLIFGKAAVRVMTVNWYAILMNLPRKRSGARLGDGLSAVVWSLAESCRREDEPLERVRRVMDAPVYRVPCSSSKSL